MNESSFDYEVPGELIKLIHGELPAVRWTCGNCGDDACTIFYDLEAGEMVVECESCKAINLIRRQLNGA